MEKQDLGAKAKQPGYYLPAEEKAGGGVGQGGHNGGKAITAWMWPAVPRLSEKKGTGENECKRQCEKFVWQKENISNRSLLDAKISKREHVS